jgi:REP element-mobilizing transposase RayT
VVEIRGAYPVEGDFHWLALAFNRARVIHPFLLTAWVFLRDHWHAICAPAYPLTISLVMKSIKTSSMILINRRRNEPGSADPRFRGPRHFVRADGLPRKPRARKKSRGPQNRQSALPAFQGKRAAGLRNYEMS